jgi:hypothetical protein
LGIETIKTTFVVKVIIGWITTLTTLRVKAITIPARHAEKRGKTTSEKCITIPLREDPRNNLRKTGRPPEDPRKTTGRSPEDLRKTPNLA